jgi:pSer/pThr/pTyr-binding forkhead associated (FHA) protein
MAELARSHGDALTVGRNYDNDVVITDPYVDPQQITFLRSAGEWQVRVIQETNPALVNGKPIGDDGAGISSGDRITIGRTQLRVYGSDHAVEPTRKMLLSSWFGRGRSHPLFALSMVVFACAVSMFAQYQELSTEVKWNEMFSVSLWLAVIILFWASAWALAGRLLRHQPNFTAQLGFTALITGFLSILLPLESYIEYAANSVLLGEVAMWLIMLVILAVLFRANLSFATNLKHYTVVAFIAASALLLTSYTMLEFSEEEFYTEPEYTAVLKPPFARLSGSRDVQEYRDTFDSLFDEADTLARQD